MLALNISCVIRISNVFHPLVNKYLLKFCKLIGLNVGRSVVHKISCMIRVEFYFPSHYIHGNIKENVVSKDLFSENIQFSFAVCNLKCALCT